MLLLDSSATETDFGADRPRAVVLLLDSSAIAETEFGADRLLPASHCCPQLNSGQTGCYPPVTAVPVVVVTGSDGLELEVDPLSSSFSSFEIGADPFFSCDLLLRNLFM